MNNKRKTLGRGLEALLGSSFAAPAAPAADAVRADRDGELRSLPVDLLQRGRYQPRRDMRPETLEELAQSITAQGIVQPLVVRAIGTGTTGTRYEIIAGERRWRAAQMAGLHEVPALIRELTDEAALALALIENIQREDLKPLEEAQALQRLIDEFALTHEAAAQAVGRSRAAVSNLLRLLDLHGEVQNMLEREELEMGHARALLALADAQQVAAARQVARQRLSVRATEQLVRRLLAGAETEAPTAATPADSSASADIRRLEAELTDSLGARVRVQHGRDGTGRLLIEYHTLDELDGILAHIRRSGD